MKVYANSLHTSASSASSRVAVGSGRGLFFFIEGVKLMQDLGTFHVMTKWPTTQKNQSVSRDDPPEPERG